LENTLITGSKLSIIVLGVLLCASTFDTQAGGGQQDAKAIEVLKKAAAYRESLDQTVIKGVSFTDARLDAGLMVSNSEEIHVSVDRPGSMKISTFDGETTKGLYFHDGLLTVFSSANKLYAQAKIPKELDAAMKFALEELGVEAPLMDLLYKDISTHLINSDETILYLTDKSRINGTDCHHLAIRGPNADVQLWVEEGDRPVARKIMITSKWEGGAPRFVANLDWDTKPEFKPGTFEFKAPEGAVKIEFTTDNSQP
jgi:hypothetical protein